MGVLCKQLLQGCLPVAVAGDFRLGVQDELFACGCDNRVSLFVCTYVCVCAHMYYAMYEATTMQVKQDERALSRRCSHASDGFSLYTTVDRFDVI